MLREEYDLEVSGGGVILVREWGDPDGPLVIFHHGTPSSSIAIPSGWEAAAASPLRLCSFDRPGYGGSPRMPNRAVADASLWSQTIADHLGQEDFAVIGTSGGGPHAAAAAALLPDRVAALVLDVSLGPTDTPELARLDQPDDTRAEMLAAQESEAALRSFIEALGPTEESLDGWMDILPDSDREVLSRPQVKREEDRERIEWSARGIDGWVDDDRALFARPWGFDPATISAPVRIAYGDADALVPPAHALAWAQRVPHAQVSPVPGGGHWLRDHEPELLDWLHDELVSSSTRSPGRR